MVESVALKKDRLPPEIETAVLRRLNDQEARFTPSRRAVVAELTRAEGPITPAGLHQRLAAEIPVSSLYRTLAILDQAGVVERTHDTEGITRFELAEWLNGHHHHIVCVECGEVRDIDVDGEWERTIADLIKQVAGAAGYAASGHRIDIEGKCSKCR